MTKQVAIATLVTTAGACFAGTYSEVESNNTLGTANWIGAYSAPGGSLIIDGSIQEGDVDWFEFTLNDDASLSVFAAFAFGSGADGVMQLVSDAGDVIAFDDDSGVGLMPAIQLETLTAGTYYIGLSGFGDVGSSSVDSDELADGLGHSENFQYKMTVGFSVVPAPGTLALAGLGGMALTRRRR